MVWARGENLCPPVQRERRLAEGKNTRHDCLRFHDKLPEQAGTTTTGHYAMHDLMHDGNLVAFNPHAIAHCLILCMTESCRAQVRLKCNCDVGPLARAIHRQARVAAEPASCPPAAECE